MDGQIQFAQTLGDGSKTTHTYVKGDLEISGKNGKLYYFDDEWITLMFTILDLSMDCNFLSITGSNKDGYGRVNFLFNTNEFWNSNLEEIRLIKSYKTSPEAFRRRHGIEIEEEIDFTQLSIKQVENHGK